jgi:hypothetical protein
VIRFEKYICVLATLALGGCASTSEIPASAQALGALQGQKLTVITYGLTDFTETTLGKSLTQDIGLALGGTAGGAGIGAASYAATVGEGSTRGAADNGVRDPALDISAKLVPIARNKLNPSDTKILSGVTAKDNDPATLAKLAGNSGTIFDVQTFFWGFGNQPFATRYDIFVDVRARVIDASSRKIVAQAFCGHQSDTANPPTYDQMFENHAALIKAVIAAGGESCANTLQKAIFGGA